MEDDIIRISMEDLEKFEKDVSGSGNSETNLSDWDPRKTTPNVKQPVDIILCIDTSGSMEATDYPPSRMVAAKQAALMFTNRKILQNYHDRVGVIGFGGQAAIYHPLDNKLDQVASAINQLQITHSGTMIGTALSLAHKELLKVKTKRGAIVLLSDGGDEYDTSNPVQTVSQFNSIKVFTVGLGTVKGADVSLPIGVVRVRLNETILKKIAKTTRGEYLHAPDIQELQKIYLRLADY